MKVSVRGKSFLRIDSLILFKFVWKYFRREVRLPIRGCSISVEEKRHGKRERGAERAIRGRHERNKMKGMDKTAEDESEKTRLERLMMMMNVISTKTRRLGRHSQ